MVAFTGDEFGHAYTGIPDIEGEKGSMNDAGHVKTIGGLAAEEIRARYWLHHMTLINSMVACLQSVSEAGGSMFANTMIFYFPDGGEMHHSHETEYLFLVMAGDNARLAIGRRYIHLPGYGQQAHPIATIWTSQRGHGIWLWYKRAETTVTASTQSKEKCGEP